ncbi:trichoplein keratin filament-binding protein-like [Acanthaster planci]|uniref:Trichoplein keratin filament-binding protein n=1 Tax=Acanthaster planci TaxID=133434 RepID=A0A8B7ZMN6_ACAPL|nr:trichoplein keratin filament-binding protein-like [Acanthaster planci]
MALPTMPAYWTSRYKNIQERAMVQRRTHEADFREKWGNNAQYFKSSDVKTTKQRAWTSDQSFHNSMDAYRKRDERELRALRLRNRRHKLKQLLDDERERYAAELRGLSLGNYERLKGMKERTDELKSQKEEKRKQIADQRLYDHWRQNNPDLRKIESEMHKKHVVHGWGEQVDSHREQLESARREEQQEYREMEQDRQAALEKERQAQQAKLREEKQLAEQLKEQMNELRQREAEAERLKQEQDRLLQRQWELDKLEEERQAMEEQRKKSQMARALSRQYKAQLRRRAKEVQEALEFDRKILEALVEKESEEQQIQTTRREKAKADAAWMKQVVEEQLKLEKAREAELDMLYKDEAAREWQKREHEWEKERLARERLMHEVLQGQQAQIDAHMDENRRRQEESLQQREELVREMELVQQMTQREKAEEERRKAETRREVESQLTERQQRQEAARELMQKETEAERQAERDYEEMLRQEASRMSLHDFQPKSYPRKGPGPSRSAWE